MDELLKKFVADTENLAEANNRLCECEKAVADAQEAERQARRAVHVAERRRSETSKAIFVHCGGVLAH